MMFTQQEADSVLDTMKDFLRVIKKLKDIAPFLMKNGVDPTNFAKGFSNEEQKQEFLDHIREIEQTVSELEDIKCHEV